MVIMIRLWRIHRFRPLATAIVVVLVLPGRDTAAADWSVVPALRLRESYSDNVSLAPPAQATGDFISEIAPSISILGNGPRLKLNLAFTVQKLIYQRQPDVSEHQLQATANAALLEDWLFVDLHDSIAQRNVSAFGPQALDNIPRAGNRSTVSADSVSPYMLHHFRGLATAEMRYTHSAVSSDDGVLSAKTDGYLLKLSGDTRGHGWNWGASVERSTTKDPRLDDVRMSRAALTLNVPLSSKLALFGSVGRENQGYVSATQTEPSGRYWSLGTGWYPSTRTSVVVSGGKRFFGNTYSFDASHRGRHTTWSLGYSEDITSTPGQFTRLSGGDTANLLNQLWSTSIPDPLLRQQQVDAFLRFSQLLGPDVGAVNYFSHSYYLQKQLSLNMLAGMHKSTLLLGLTSTRRTAQTSSAIDSVLLPATTLGLDDRTRQTGLNVAWNWRMSARDSFAASAAYSTVNSLTLARKDTNLVYSASLNHTFQPKISGEIDVRRVRHGSTAADGYRENAVGATLVFRF